MKKIQKFMNKKGFSLVELIIVIAIMAALIAVLAPQYLKYVNKSRKTADQSSVDEVVTAMKIALSDPELTRQSADFTVTYPKAGGTLTTGAANTEVAKAITDACGSVPALKYYTSNVTIDYKVATSTTPEKITVNYPS